MSVTTTEGPQNPTDDKKVRVVKSKHNRNYAATDATLINIRALKARVLKLERLVRKLVADKAKNHGR